MPETRAPRWLVLATRQIAARPAFAVLQVSALAVGLLALVLLVLLRTDLIGSWRQATPPDAPNRFVINLQPEQGDAFRAALARAGVQRYDWYPMIRGRLVAINGRTITAEDYADERARRLVEREFNLSHVAQAPAHNEIVAGRWVDDEAGGLSVEEGLAQDARAQDRRHAALRHRRPAAATAASPACARSTGARCASISSCCSRWREMTDVPLTYISAFHAPDTPGFDNALSRDFPNITSVDVSASIAQVQRVLDQVIRAVEFLFGFTLVAGLVVLFAAVTATREARAREFAIMRAMGAGSRLLGQVQRAELLGVGALAGVLASLAAIVGGLALARYAFEFSLGRLHPGCRWRAPPQAPLLALAAGWWGLREVLRRPVLETLRRAGAV